MSNPTRLRRRLVPTVAPLEGRLAPSGFLNGDTPIDDIITRYQPWTVAEELPPPSPTLFYD